MEVFRLPDVGPNSASHGNKQVFILFMSLGRTYTLTNATKAGWVDDSQILSQVPQERSPTPPYPRPLPLSVLNKTLAIAMECTAPIVGTGGSSLGAAIAMD
ncbi:unnamed protein product [Ascophyllum nodosum]